MATPFPILQTERLMLRKILPDDLAKIYHLRTDPEINKYIKREPQSMETTKAHLQLISAELRNGKSITWGITRKESNDLIGTICLWNFSADKKTAELGYALDTKFHGIGIMGEALKIVLDYAFNFLGLKTIEAYTNSQNISSKKLLRRHGFIPNYNIKEPENQSNMIYYLNR